VAYLLHPPCRLRPLGARPASGGPLLLLGAWWLQLGAWWLQLGAWWLQLGAWWLQLGGCGWVLWLGAVTVSPCPWPPVG
jgi:hypothetical protein